MINLPDKAIVKKLRHTLDTNGFGTGALTERFGSAVPPRPGDDDRLLHLTRMATTANALVRLFLLGTSVDEAIARDALPDELISECLKAGLIETEDGRIRARIVIVPIEKMLFASDAFRVLDSRHASDFVLPASTHSANFLRRLTMRSPVANTLDLGCGCGIHAMFAARHSDSVVATDINPAAVRYTEFNALLNGFDNIRCLEGSLFEPVADRSFDLITCNPPFVIGPDTAFVYRDNTLELDDFCKLLVREAPRYLNAGGHLQMLCETAEFDGEPWDARMKTWVNATGCDAWLLHSPPLHPVHYVSRRLSDVSGEGIDDSTRYEDWVGYFEARKVTALHPVMIALRKRRGRNWVHVHNLAADVGQDAGDAVRRGFSACDFLERCSDDETLLDATLRIAPELTLEQQFARVEENWQPTKSLLRMTNGLAMDAEVDMPIMAALNQIDGKTTLRKTLEEFSRAVGADTAKLTADVLPIMRLFIGRGFLEPADGPS